VEHAKKNKWRAKKVTNTNSSQAEQEDEQELGVSEENKLSSLLVFQAEINGKLARVMIDSGASHNFVAKNWIQLNDVYTQSYTNEKRVTMADGTQAVNGRYLKDAKIRLGQHKGIIDLDVMELQKYDAILGLEWMRGNKVEIGWDSSQLIIKTGSEEIVVEEVKDHKGKIEHCTSEEISEEEINNIEVLWQRRIPLIYHKDVKLNLVTPTKLRKALKKGAELYLFMVKTKPKNASMRRNEKKIIK